MSCVQKRIHGQTPVDSFVNALPAERLELLENGIDGNLGNSELYGNLGGNRDFLAGPRIDAIPLSVVNENKLSNARKIESMLVLGSFIGKVGQRRQHFCNLNLRKICPIA